MIILKDKNTPPPTAILRWVADIAAPSHRERDDSYHGEIVELGARWRVVLCKYRIQWILQRRSKNPPHPGYWRGQSYFTSRDALLEACARRELLSDPQATAVLEAPPEWARYYRKK